MNTLPLIHFDAVSLRFGDQLILKDADLSIASGERVCLIGRNGAGKTTTLKLITGQLEPDEGKIERPARVRTSVLEQTLADASEDTVHDFVAGGVADQLRRIERFEQLSARKNMDDNQLREIEALEREVVAAGGWAVDNRIDVTITQLDLPRDKKMSELSGGWRRRVALARAFVSNADLLLLDEPTNHLDISTIEWLENQIKHYPGAVLFVTHDRSFVEHVATRIVDIDRGVIRSWPGGYRDYLRQKRKTDQDEDARNKLFDKKLDEEEAWIRQGIKAREHRNEGRVRALHAMREQRSTRVARARAARIHINEAEELSGRKVIEAKNVTHGYGGQTLIADLSLRIMRGDRIGIIGNNGVGKSTLLRLLLGELQPQSGSIKLGTNLEVAYFDQLRRELDTSKTVAELIGEGRDYLSINGKPKHVVAYLTDFLFTPKRAMTSIAALSGGERNRVVLAKLFTRSANLLVLDEPTNDLDVETLEALEDRLRKYSGTLIVVSHDRHFLDAVVTSTLVFEADGRIRKYSGGYSDWARKHRALAVGEEAPGAAGPKRVPPPEPKRKVNRKLSYKLRRELDALPDQIERHEARVAALQAEVTAPAFYRQPHEQTQRRLAELAEAEKQLDAAMNRWAELESLAQEHESG
jgi:ATP-binding cassette subfamily F protein uup